MGRLIGYGIGLASELGTLLAPLALQHDGHPVDHDVQEAAHHQAQYQASANE
jgi:hypothetical protein